MTQSLDDRPRTDAAGAPARPLSALLRQRLAGSCAPVLMVGDRTLPAASLWVAARALVARLRDAGLAPGDRLLLIGGDDLATVVGVVAGVTGGFATAVVPAPPAAPGASAVPDAVVRAADAVAARVLLAPCTLSGVPAGDAIDDLAPVLLRPDGSPLGDDVLRPARHPANELAAAAVCLLLPTSGTTGTPRWTALSEENVASVLASHLPVLFGAGWDPDDACARPAGVVASVLAWEHAFGLVLDLLLGLVAAQVVVRDRAAAADPARLGALLDRAGSGAWLSAVPRTLTTYLAAAPGGVGRLADLAGGVVGGAVPDADLCRALEGTALRPGYGLTQAGPGVCLGEPGRVGVGRIGVPVGCTVTLRPPEPSAGPDQPAELLVAGPNVAVGLLDADARLLPFPPGPLPTGDLVRADGPDGPDGPALTLVGRTQDVVKLDNGRWVVLGALDEELREAAGCACAVLVPAGRGLHVLVDGGSQALARVLTRLTGPTAPFWAGRVREVRATPSADWPRTAKGAIDRYRDPDTPPAPVAVDGRHRPVPARHSTAPGVQP